MIKCKINWQEKDLTKYSNYLYFEFLPDKGDFLDVPIGKDFIQGNYQFKTLKFNKNDYCENILWVEIFDQSADLSLSYTEEYQEYIDANQDK